MDSLTLGNYLQAALKWVVLPIAAHFMASARQRSIGQDFLDLSASKPAVQAVAPQMNAVTPYVS
jgi:hypothetical protein